MPTNSMFSRENTARASFELLIGEIKIVSEYRVGTMWAMPSIDLLSTQGEFFVFNLFLTCFVRNL